MMIRIYAFQAKHRKRNKKHAGTMLKTNHNSVEDAKKGAPKVSIRVHNWLSLGSAAVIIKIILCL